MPCCLLITGVYGKWYAPVWDHKCVLARLHMCCVHAWSDGDTLYCSSSGTVPLHFEAESLTAEARELPVPSLPWVEIAGAYHFRLFGVYGLNSGLWAGKAGTLLMAIFLSLLMLFVEVSAQCFNRLGIPPRNMMLPRLWCIKGYLSVSMLGCPYMIGFWKNCALMSRKIKFVVWFVEEGIYEVGTSAKETEFLAFS